MNTLRVDLLKPEEFRYQGAVSREFLIRAIVGAVLGVVVLLTCLSLVRGHLARKELATSQVTWAAMEPRYERVREMQMNLGVTRSLANELQSWQTSRINWNDALERLGALVPAEVQLTKLSIKSDLLMVDEEGKRTNEGGTLVRNYTLTLDGRASGELADETVVQFMDSINTVGTFTELLESVRLQGLQRMRGDEGQRIFGIEAVAKPRVFE